MRSIVALLFLSCFQLHAAEVSIMTYNVENLFDTEDDPFYNDDDFLPRGRYAWDREKLDWKLINLSKVVMSVKNPDGSICPDILGLVEVENRAVIEYWKDNFMSECGYKNIAIYDHDPRDPVEDDGRGIKVALVTKYPITAYENHPVYNGGRYILEVELEVHSRKLRVFVNHWKSRIGDGEDKRMMSAATLKELVSHKTVFEDIVAIGDMNDEPEDKSFTKVLKIVEDYEEMFEDVSEAQFWDTSFERFNIPRVLHFAQNLNDQGQGNYYLPEVEVEARRRRSTYYFSREREFLQLDHILLTRGLFHADGFIYKANSFEVFRPTEFTKDKYIPIPFRPDQDGAIGGASDHFPILIRLETSECRNQYEC